MLVYNIAPSCLFPPVSNRVRLCFFFLKLLFVNPFDICLSAEAKDKLKPYGVIAFQLGTKSGGSGLRTLTPSHLATRHLLKHMSAKPAQNCTS